MRRPPPVRTDQTNAFANNTMRVRLPAIIDETLALNPDYDAGVQTRLRNLREEIAAGARIPSLPATADDHDEWQLAIDRQREIVCGEPGWHNAEWFFAETYAYRWLVEATRWHETGRDPFAPKKLEELHGDALWRLLERSQEPAHSQDDALHRALALDLWANRIDLSYAASMRHGTETHEDDLLVDDRDSVVAHLSDMRTGAVHVIADNAGSELAMDLALADVLLREADARVIVWLKAHPTFVSDATPQDVWLMLDELTGRGGRIAELSWRLRDAWSGGRLRLIPHRYWNSSRFLWDMPATLRGELDSARLVIIKGDANYRRSVGDCLWDAHTPFAHVMACMDAPTLCLRTLKSDPVVGLPSADMATQLDTADPDWRVNGKRGLIQFKPRQTASR